MSARTVRFAVGRADVARALRAAAPLMADLRAPVTARAPWLTAVLNGTAARRSIGTRPVAVVVEGPGRPDAAAFLTAPRRRPTGEVRLLGQGVGPTPPGRPPFRLLARDRAAAELLADGICRLLGGTRSLRLVGLPLGDPTARALSVRLPDGLIANGRSTRVLDELDTVGTVARSRDPGDVDRWLPQLLERVPVRREAELLRASARLHAAIGQLEVAVVAERGLLRAGLLTLVDGADRWPWWGWSAGGGLGSEMGAPLVAMTAPARRWP
ncbi:hypothetical protein [Blastococcus sp. PRF04-17]|uniref:hypothetical protein n=1 Tax=Blastococcus sp. PRF04-17 TaxID=2933797 RepID=UPI001FF35A59|nr:hypothetical protein [Blastococcus sp. PRF04-17]UOY01245.1 hypothetical protein MVA48_20190 [Blastococcus sp. PRF04-17]